MVGILLVGLPMVARVAGEPLLGEAFETYWTESSVTAAGLTYAVVLAKGRFLHGDGWTGPETED